MQIENLHAYINIEIVKTTLVKSKPFSNMFLIIYHQFNVWYTLLNSILIQYKMILHD